MKWRKVCGGLALVMFGIAVHTPGAMDNGLPERTGYIQMGIFLLLAVGFAVAAAVEWEYIPEEKEEPKWKN